MTIGAALVRRTHGATVTDAGATAQTTPTARGSVGEGSALTKRAGIGTAAPRAPAAPAITSEETMSLIPVRLTTPQAVAAAAAGRGSRAGRASHLSNSLFLFLFLRQR